MIQSAAPGDTVELKPGEYYQTITIPKKIVLRAKTPGTAVLEGGSKSTFAWTVNTGLIFPTFTGILFPIMLSRR